MSGNRVHDIEIYSTKMEPVYHGFLATMPVNVTSKAKGLIDHASSSLTIVSSHPC